ncbi:sugar phosphate nucleotidyltransferase [Gaiella sp.]|jgi:mannose-1-phosphate guanylyltransferase/phosphomannomutase|uniref:sugar phosphate nucleotidyltransferase n=1 Tax=Gaiella sp. TaxID=2663207 RepID=UPI002C0FC23C|nr:sugar phosphate nucleotidyltransferase [Gaiella sp.]HWO80049.1 sugar phosphate nucleotidyltransferase [Gaiella sp.]
MAGGEGTRLRPLTSNQPKPMVPIVGKPCMEHILDLLRRHDMHEVVVTLAFMPQAIRTYFGDGTTLEMDVDYSVEEQPLGTAGSVRLARERLDDTFLVISGDALCDVDLTGLVAAHREKGAAVTIALKSVDNPLEFGIVVTDEDGRVERFLEKPSWGQVFSDTINTGIYVLEPEVLRHIPTDRPYDFSKELFPLLLEMGRPIYGHVLDGYWQDIGNLEQFRQANFDALDGRVQLDIPGLRLRGNVWVSEEVDINEVAGVAGPAFIGANCRIADGASIGAHAVLSQGVIVREGARVTRSVVDAGSYLGRSSVVEGAIIGRGCDLRDHVRVHEGVAIGDQVTIGPEATLFPGVRVYPFKEIETGAQIHESVVWETRAASTPFGREGATGLVNVDLTPETAVRLAAALGTALRRGDRVVASRASADACRMIQRAIISGLTSTGVHVADLRISPAAVTRHVLKTQALQAGIHVGRSSVDPEMIDVRFFEWPGNQMTATLQKEVEKHFSRHELRRATFAEVGETTYPARVRESYAQDILDSLDAEAVRRRRFRVALDYGYSPAAFTLPLVLGPLGVEAIAAHGFFVEDVADELGTVDARRIVTGVRADLGVVLDRAAERLLLVDERGEAVPADLGMLLVVKLLVLAGREGRIAVPITATDRVDELVAGSALEIVRTQHSLGDLTRAATEDGVVLAVAPTGGFVFPDVVPGYDAVTTVCRLLELLAGQEPPISELVAQLPRPTLVHRELPCPWSRKGLVMRLVNEQLADRRLDLMDGVKAYDDRGWVQVLPDPDEPLVHVYAEGETEELTGELAGEVAGFVEVIVQGEGVEQRTLEQASS